MLYMACMTGIDTADLGETKFFLLLYLPNFDDSLIETGVGVLHRPSRSNEASPRMHDLSVYVKTWMLLFCLKDAFVQHII